MSCAINNCKKSIKINKVVPFLTVAFFCQLLFWFSARKISPQFTIVPNVPSKLEVKSLAFGDEQFYFRVLGTKLQTAGDSFGRFTALKDYDYNKLYLWFKVLDELDSNSHFIPSLASYYYSQTQNAPDTIYVINYLEEHSLQNVDKNWWWLVQAIYLAKTRLNDEQLALKLSYKLLNTKEDVPLWAKHLPAIILARTGDKQKSLEMILQVLENTNNITAGEMNYIYYFITERLGLLEEAKQLEKEGKIRYQKLK